MCPAAAGLSVAQSLAGRHQVYLACKAVSMQRQDQAGRAQENRPLLGWVPTPCGVSAVAPKAVTLAPEAFMLSASAASIRLATMSAKIGQLLFTDGRTGDVYRDALGQFVLGDDGTRMDGVWLF